MSRSKMPSAALPPNVGTYPTKPGWTSTAPIRKEILHMIEILTIQVLTAVLGMSSTATADLIYNKGRVNRRLHSLWVAISSTVICFPILSWTFIVFLGDDIISWMLIGLVLSLMFFWQYYGLQKIPPVQRIRSGPISMASASRSVPPSSNVSR